MTTTTNQSDLTDPDGQPSEEELRVYLERLREAEVGEIVLQAYTMLGSGAEVKLGRPDARVLIDAMAGLVSSVGRYFQPDLARQLQASISQLQVAQVEAEKEAAGGQPAAAPPAPPRPAATTAQPVGGTAQPVGGTARPAGRTAQPAGGTAQPAGGAPQPPGGAPDKSMTDRLWIPGRGPRPGGA